MNDRYSRQTILPEIGEAGQERLAHSCVAIVGCGGLGSAAAELLARSGVSKLLLLDYDVVELSNLQRQALYTQKDIGMPKAQAAANHLKEINKDVEILEFVKQLNPVTIDLVKDADLILDCTDNLQTRFLINEYSLKTKIPFIYCGAVETQAMLYVVDANVKDRACFACIFDRLNAIENCEDFGVLATTVRLAATLQVAEALKLLAGKAYTPGLISLNAWDLRLEAFIVRQKPGCPVCAGHYDRLDGKAPMIEYCTTRRCIKARPNRQLAFDIDRLRASAKIAVLSHDAHSLHLQLDGQGIIVYPHGALDFPGLKDQDEARRLTEKILELGKK